MANVCIVRHKPYIKSKMHFPYQHNLRSLKNYGNKNIDLSLTHLNTCIVNNLKNGETYLSAFNRMYESGEFKGQLKVQGAVDKQTKFLDEFLIYPPYEKITEMNIEEQEAFFRKELKALQKYFPYMNILSAHVHRDEIFHPLDDEMKELFPEGKVTPHMHVVAIPIVYDEKKDCKKISISELWKGKFSYRKFQDHMYNTVGKEYGFDRGGKHDFGEAQNQEIQNQQEKLSELEKEFILEKDRTNDILNIKVSDERLRQVYLDEAKHKIKLYDLVVRIIKDFLPELIKASPKFIRKLFNFKILHNEDLPGEHENNSRKGR